MVFNDFCEFSVSEELFSVTLTIYILTNTFQNIMHAHPWYKDDLEVFYIARMSSKD